MVPPLKHELIEQYMRVLYVPSSEYTHVII